MVIEVETQAGAEEAAGEKGAAEEAETAAAESEATSAEETAVETETGMASAALGMKKAAENWWLDKYQQGDQLEKRSSRSSTKISSGTGDKVNGSRISGIMKTRRRSRSISSSCSKSMITIRNINFSWSCRSCNAAADFPLLICFGLLSDRKENIGIFYQRKYIFVGKKQ